MKATYKSFILVCLFSFITPAAAVEQAATMVNHESQKHQKPSVEQQEPGAYYVRTKKTRAIKKRKGKRGILAKIFKFCFFFVGGNIGAGMVGQGAFVAAHGAPPIWVMDAGILCGFIIGGILGYKLFDVVFESNHKYDEVYIVTPEKVAIPSVDAE